MSRPGSGPGGSEASRVIAPEAGTSAAAIPPSSGQTLGLEAARGDVPDAAGVEGPSRPESQTSVTEADKNHWRPPAKYDLPHCRRPLSSRMRDREAQVEVQQTAMRREVLTQLQRDIVTDVVSPWQEKHRGVARPPRTPLRGSPDKLTAKSPDSMRTQATGSTQTPDPSRLTGATQTPEPAHVF